MEWHISSDTLQYRKIYLAVIIKVVSHLNLKIQLFATFREGRGKDVFFDIETGTAVGGIIQKLRLKQEDIAIRLVNGRDGKLHIQLKEGDYISLFPPVGGG